MQFQALILCVECRRTDDHRAARFFPAPLEMEPTACPRLLIALAMLTALAQLMEPLNRPATIASIGPDLFQPAVLFLQREQQAFGEKIV